MNSHAKLADDIPTDEAGLPNLCYLTLEARSMVGQMLNKYRDPGVCTVLLGIAKHLVEYECMDQRIAEGETDA
jgi:hypothetical protein